MALCLLVAFGRRVLLAYASSVYDATQSSSGLESESGWYCIWSYCHFGYYLVIFALPVSTLVREGCNIGIICVRRLLHYLVFVWLYKLLVWTRCFMEFSTMMPAIN